MSGKKRSGGKKGEKRAQSSQDHSDGSQKKQRRDPRKMLGTLTVDNHKSEKVKERNQYIRQALDWACNPGVEWVKERRPGWKATCDRFPLLDEYYNNTSFKTAVKSLREAQAADVPFDVDDVTIGGGRKPTTSHKEKMEIAEAGLRAHIQGKEKEVAVLRRERDPEAPHLTRRQQNALLKAIQKDHKVNAGISDPSTVSQNRENYDLRNPVVHAVGILEMYRKADGSDIPPQFRFKFDVTGKGLLKKQPQGKVLTVRDSIIPRKSEGAKRTQIKFNSKLVSYVYRSLAPCS